MADTFKLGIGDTNVCKKLSLPLKSLHFREKDRYNETKQGNQDKDFNEEL